MNKIIFLTAFIVSALGGSSSLNASEEVADVRAAYRRAAYEELVMDSQREKAFHRPAEDSGNKNYSAPFPVEKDNSFALEPSHASAGNVIEA